MLEEFVAVIHSIGVTLFKILPVSIALGAIFTVLSFFWACNPGPPWWRKRELVTDLCYWFIIPLFARYLRIGLLVMGAAFLFGITTAEGLVEFYDDGHGPLARLPLVAAGGDLSGRLGFDDVLDAPRIPPSRAMEVSRGPSFVRGSRLDLGRAVSSDQYFPRQRRHRRRAAAGGDLAERAGFPGPFTIAHSAFVHANLNWTLGPFKYLIAGPVFHRWHHTMAERGGEKNFASTFPVLDLLFGTFYMPKNELPDAYGIADPSFPPSFGQQMLYPFKR